MAVDWMHRAGIASRDIKVGIVRRHAAPLTAPSRLAATVSAVAHVYLIATPSSSAMLLARRRLTSTPCCLRRHR